MFIVEMRFSLSRASFHARWEVRGVSFFFFQAEDGIRDAQESRGLGDVYKRQPKFFQVTQGEHFCCPRRQFCLLYTSDAADEEDSVDLGGRRIIKKKKQKST